jgi:hypothetical protein
VREDRSPEIRADQWGQIDVDGLGSFRDAKLWPGGGRAWDWNETGTQHEPGIQPSDIEELLTHDPEVIVLSCGRERRLRTCPETLSALREHGVEVIHDETSIAISLYNRLAAEGRRVAALIHSTC